MKTQIQNFLNTSSGSFVKTFISAVFTLYVAELVSGRQLFEFDWMMWKKVLTAAVISTAPMITNWLNPRYMQYGITQEIKEVDKIVEEHKASVAEADASIANTKIE